MREAAILCCVLSCLFLTPAEGEAIPRPDMGTDVWQVQYFDSLNMKHATGLLLCKTTKFARKKGYDYFVFIGPPEENIVDKTRRHITTNPTLIVDAIVKLSHTPVVTDHKSVHDLWELLEKCKKWGGAYKWWREEVQELTVEPPPPD